jgi:ABC-2 type transport system permease protein
MSALAYTIGDSATMLRRNLKHQLRYPSMTLMLVGMPIVFLLLFVYVFGGQLGAGLNGGHGGRGTFLTYVVPGILIVTVASAALGTAISVAMDMTGGIIDRFRTMAIARGAVLTGHVIGSLIQTLVGVAIVLGVALAVGLRLTAGPFAWLAVIGVLILFAFALIWLSTALGLAAKSVETASNTPMLLTLLPFLSSGFRAHPLHAGRAAPVRRIPALHPRHPDCPRPAHRHPARHRHHHRRPGLECRHRPRQLSLGHPAVQPPTPR